MGEFRKTITLEDHLHLRPLTRFITQIQANCQQFGIRTVSVTTGMGERQVEGISSVFHLVGSEPGREFELTVRGPYSPQMLETMYRSYESILMASAQGQSLDDPGDFY